jgi:hypothetical protein
MMAEQDIFTTEEFREFRERIEKLKRRAEQEVRRALRVNLGGAEKEYFAVISEMHNRLEEAALCAVKGFEVLYRPENYKK